VNLGGLIGISDGAGFFEDKVDEALLEARVQIRAVAQATTTDLSPDWTFHSCQIPEQVNDKETDGNESKAKAVIGKRTPQ